MSNSTTVSTHPLHESHSPSHQITLENLKHLTHTTTSTISTSSGHVYNKLKQTSQSVFGNAPTLKMMKLMNSKSQNKGEILFRGVEFWYTYRLYYPYITPFIWVLGLIICLTGWNTIEGHMIIGGLISFISCLLIILSYFMIIPWRKHPSTIILYRTISNLFFSLGIIFMAISYHIDPSSHSCGFYSSFIHFFLLSSEGWCTMIALDLLYSITNPFVSYHGNMRRYHFIIWTFSTLLTFSLYNNSSCQGRIQDGLCWLSITDGFYDSCLWGYYLFWICCMYLFQLFVIIYSYHKLKKGLSLTFEIRKQCTIETFQCLLYYAIYLVIISISFIILISSSPSSSSPSSSSSSSSFSSSTSPNHHWITFGNVFLYFVSCRGYVDNLVWFRQHDFARESSENLLKKSIVLTSTENNALRGVGDVEESGPALVTVNGRGEEKDEYDDIEEVDLDEDPSSSSAKGRGRTNSISKFNLGETLEAMNHLGESAVMSFDEADLSPQVLENCPSFHPSPSPSSLPSLLLPFSGTVGEHGITSTNCEICHNGNF
jgi:hypothetical protein